MSLTVVVEPDRQRLARFAIEAIDALGGNVFSATTALKSALSHLRGDGSMVDAPQDIELEVDSDKVCLAWGNHREVLAKLQEPPSKAVLIELTESLTNASESTDPELLRRRNQQIRADLELAKERAATEMAELETVLEKKKQELQESMRLAETDSLTGLLNRGAYDHWLPEAVLRCQRQQEALSLVVLDLDNLKENNDTRGHQYGDELLKRMANAMCSAVREHVDLSFRIGGDEFAIVLLTDMTVGERIAQEIIQDMEQQVSIGITEMHPDDDVDSLITRADGALYEAKHQGRGRFVIADYTTPAKQNTA